jgi:hypothetical protein
MQLGQCLLVERVALWVLLSQEFERVREGIPGNRRALAAFDINYRMVGNAKQPGRERQTALLVSGQRVQRD